MCCLLQKHAGGEKTARWLEGPDHVISWAVGLQLAEPDEYDDRFKKWRMADLPIVPGHFKLVVRDERSQKQMTAVASLLGREDIDHVVNACDAGREGELIFAYLYEYARSDKPVERLWLSSMTSGRCASLRRPAPRRAAHEPARGGEVALGGRLDRRDERHARGHDPPALVVRRGRVARPGADAHARHPRPPGGGDPRFGRRPTGWSTPRSRPTAPVATRAASTTARSRGWPAPSRPRRSSTRCVAAAVRSSSTRPSAPSASLLVRPHLAAARREHALRVLCAAHPGRGPALL